MNLKNTLIAAGVGILTLSGCKEDTHSPQHEIKPVKYVVEESKKEIAHNLTHPNKDNLYTIPMDRVKNGPLGKMPALAHSLQTLLGGKYADSMMQHYNKELLDTLIAHNPQLKQSVKWVDVSAIKEDIHVPLIYPTLEHYFSPSLSDFIADKPELAQQIGADREVIIITRDKNLVPNKKDPNKMDTVRKNVIGYYVDGQLSVAQYMSAGVGGSDFMEFDHRLQKHRRVHPYSKEGVFYTNYFIESGKKTDRRDSTYRSGTFGSGKHGSGLGAPMPYATPINDSARRDEGVYLHTGLADGQPRSHECNRLPGWLAMYMYDHVGDRKVKTIVHDLYNPGEEAQARKAPIGQKTKSKAKKKK